MFSFQSQWLDSLRMALGLFLCNSRPKAVKVFPWSVQVVPVQSHGCLPVTDSEGDGFVTAIMESAF